MTLEQLRQRAPSWSWSAQRAGMGWKYIGTSGERRVVVDARASMWDGDGAEPATWWASERDRTTPLVFWLASNAGLDGLDKVGAKGGGT